MHQVFEVLTSHLMGLHMNVLVGTRPTSATASKPPVSHQRYVHDKLVNRKDEPV